MNIIDKSFKNARNIVKVNGRYYKKTAHKKVRKIFKNALRKGDDTIRPAHLMTDWDIV